MERYNRNIIIDEIGEKGQRTLLNSKVLICGCGGLGSTAIANLSALGIGKIGLIDDDIVEITNMNRQYIHKFANIGKNKVDSAKEWINNFNSDIEVQTYKIRLSIENYKNIVKDYDLIIDCFDTYDSKFLLNEISINSKKPLIHGAVTEFYGQVTVVIPEETPCLHCIIPNPDRTAKITKGVVSPAVSVIAAVQSMEALKLLLKIDTSLKNILLTYNGLTMEYKKLKITKNSKCPVCT